MSEQSQSSSLLYNVLLFFLIGSDIPLCVNGEVRLNSNSSNSNNDGDTYLMQLSGNVEICYNGKFYGLCTSGNYNFQRTAELTCLTLSYKSKCLN